MKIELTNFDANMIRYELLNGIDRLKAELKNLPESLRENQNILTSFAEAVRYREELAARFLIQISPNDAS